MRGGGNKGLANKGQETAKSEESLGGQHLSEAFMFPPLALVEDGASKTVKW